MNGRTVCVLRDALIIRRVGDIGMIIPEVYRQEYRNLWRGMITLWCILGASAICIYLKLYI